MQPNNPGLSTATTSNDILSLDTRTSIASLNLSPAKFLDLQLKDPKLQMLRNFLMQPEQTLHTCSTKSDQNWLKQISKRTVLIDDVLVYRDEFMEDPEHYRCFVPQDPELQWKLLSCYHDSLQGMH